MSTGLESLAYSLEHAIRETSYVELSQAQQSFLAAKTAYEDFESALMEDSKISDIESQLAISNTPGGIKYWSKAGILLGICPLIPVACTYMADGVLPIYMKFGSMPQDMATVTTMSVIGYFIGSFLDKRQKKRHKVASTELTVEKAKLGHSFQTEGRKLRSNLHVAQAKYSRMLETFQQADVSYQALGKGSLFDERGPA